ncbi:MAG: GNAT family N-acetyltransferase [Alphaproteobacteria bacterium]|nr:GNAT family N-acetyltransferase [Alphaproteobacteria bacterium]
MSKKIETKRLKLRLANLSDSQAIMQICNDWEIIKWLQPPLTWPCNKKTSYTYLKSMLEENNIFLFVITLKNSNEDVGVIRYEISETQECIFAQRGFALSVKYWNQGIISEASLAGDCFFFENVDIKEIRAYNAITNKVSSIIKKKQGFTFKGTRKAYPEYNNGCTEEEIWILTRDQYMKHTENN